MLLSEIAQIPLMMTQPAPTQTQVPLATSSSLQSSSTPGVFQTIFLLIVCVGVIFAAYYTAKVVARRAGSASSSRHMQVLDRLNISNDKQILLIKLGDKVHMVGVSGQNINHVATIDEDDMPRVVEEASSSSSAVMGDFAQRLKDSLPFGSNKKSQTRARPDLEEMYREREQQKTREKQSEEEPPVRSGLDTLDDMVSSRRSRFDRKKDREGDDR